MTVARPPLVSQAEWEASLASLAEREAAVAAAMHELGAARKRMPMVRVDRDYRFDGPDGSLSLLELFEGRSQLILYRFFFEEGGPRLRRTPAASAVRPLPTPSRQLGLLHVPRHHLRDGLAGATGKFARLRRADGLGRHVPGTRSAPRASPPTSVSTSGSPSTSSFADGDDVYRTYFASRTARADGPADRQHLPTMFNLTPYGGQSDDETRPRAGRRRRIHSGFAVTTSSTNRRRRPTLASSRLVLPTTSRPFP